MKLSRRRLLYLLSLAPGLALRGGEPVRTHIYKPKVELAEWQLRMDGLVERELTLDMAELKKLPPAELTGVIECARNGRSFYEPGVTGMQWRYGAVGNARWAPTSPWAKCRTSSAACRSIRPCTRILCWRSI